MSLFKGRMLTKEQLKARVAIDGPTGAGKTWTAHQWARILAGPEGPVGTIDTENRSAAYYGTVPGDEPERRDWWDPPYVGFHLPVESPYNPIELRKMIFAAEADLGDSGVLIIDSLSHFWEGEGGTLDIVEEAGSRNNGGNRFAGWKEGTPAQRAMIDAIVHAPFHVIVTMRSKMEWILTEGQNAAGQTVQKPQKVGMAPVQRAGVEYEFTVVADMDLNHRMYVSKTRCSLLADRAIPPGRSHEPALEFQAWLDSGVERVPASTADWIADRFAVIEDPERKRQIKTDFVATFARPNEVTTDRMDEVEAWLTEHVGPEQPVTADEAGGTDPNSPVPVDEDGDPPPENPSGAPHNPTEHDGATETDAVLDLDTDEAQEIAS